MLTKINKKDFDRFYQILQESFPKDEFRSYRKQRELLENRYYGIYKESDETGGMMGILAAFQFPEFSFIEHLAVPKEFRNLGIGERMLQNFCKSTNKSVVLEVELPNTELNRRRIKFYQRSGFRYHIYDYIQPSIDEGRQPIPLSLMTYPNNEKTEAELDFYKDCLYKEVYGIL